MCLVSFTLSPSPFPKMASCLFSNEFDSSPAQSSPCEKFSAYMHIANYMSWLKGDSTW